MLREIVYKARDNTIDLLLKADGSAVNLIPVTKMWLDLNNDTIIKSEDGELPEGVFDWDSEGANGVLKLKLGGLTALTSGQTYEIDLIVFDASNTDGINWGKFSIEVE